MHQTLRILSLLLLLNLWLFGATRGNVKILEATESIRYLSQKIVKEYFFSYSYPKRQEIKTKLFDNLNALNQNFRTIAMSTKDSDTKDLLEFLAYNREQMLELFEQKKDFENASLMVDYGETLLEASNSIAEVYRYEFSKEESMIMTMKKIEYLLERTLKYYMISHSGLNDIIIEQVTKETIDAIEQSLDPIKNYPYPQKLTTQQKELIEAWSKSRILLERSKELFIPILLFASVSHIESLISTLTLHHSKNQ
jgi:hypothetical protein